MYSCEVWWANCHQCAESVQCSVVQCGDVVCSAVLWCCVLPLVVQCTVLTTLWFSNPLNYMLIYSLLFWLEFSAFRITFYRYFYCYVLRYVFYIFEDFIFCLSINNELFKRLPWQFLMRFSYQFKTFGKSKENLKKEKQFYCANFFVTIIR